MGFGWVQVVAGVNACPSGWAGLDVYVSALDFADGYTGEGIAFHLRFVEVFCVQVATMNVLRHIYKGDLELASGAFHVKGIVSGDLRVGEGASVDLQGIVKGNVLVLEGAKLFMRGLVGGKVTNAGGAVCVTGLVKGSVVGSQIFCDSSEEFFSA